MRKVMMGLAIAGAVLSVVAVGLVGVWVYVTTNVEQPDYTLVRSDGAIEVRDYPPLLVAEVMRRGERWEAVRAGFRPLANYIFARERGGDQVSMTAPVTQTRDDKIAMTAPVTQTLSGGAGQNGAAPDAGAQQWTVRFIMPSKYTRETLPKPGGGDVSIQNVPARRVAAIRFSGIATDELIAEQEARLQDWIKSEGLETKGPATYAYYNDPWTPGFLRRNEVMIDLAGGAG